VTKSFRTRFETLEEAGQEFDLTITDILGADYRQANTPQSGRQSGVHKITQTETLWTETTHQHQQVQALAPCPPDDLQQLNILFLKLANQRGITTNPSNFASLALDAMKLLQEHGKSNLVYKFAYCLATRSPGGDKPLFDVSRMPFGIVEYQIEFFSCTNIMQVNIVIIMQGIFQHPLGTS
jgi:hypothetical protein